MECMAGRETRGRPWDPGSRSLGAPSRDTVGFDVPGLEQSCACCPKTREVAFKSRGCGFELNFPLSGPMCSPFWTTLLSSLCPWVVRRWHAARFLPRPVSRTWRGVAWREGSPCQVLYFLSCAFSYFRWTPGDIYTTYSASPLHVRGLGSYVHPARSAAAPFSVYRVPAKFSGRCRARLTSTEARKS